MIFTPLDICLMLSGWVFALLIWVENEGPSRLWAKFRKFIRKHIIPQADSRTQSAKERLQKSATAETPKP